MELLNFGWWRKPATKETKHFTVLQRPPNRTKVDLDNYRNAVVMAERAQRPDRTALYDLYKEQMGLDAHLRGIWAKRVLNILNKEIEYTTAAGEPDDTANKFLNVPAFDKFLGDVMNTITWGFSLFEFGGYPERTFTYELIPRKHVKPETGQVVTEQSESEGVNFGSDDLVKWVLPFGEVEDLGLLMTAIYYSIQKRNLMGDWANYTEMAGNNFRQVTYEGNDVMTKNATESALKQSSANGIVSLPDGVKVDYVNNSSVSQNQLFTSTAAFLNGEQSKLILGQTMTTDDGSSRSQAEVHEGQQNDIFLSDEVYVLNFLNYDFKPYMKYWGLSDSGEFGFKKHQHIKEQLENDKMLIDLGYVFTPEYLKEKYNIDD